MLHNNQTHNIVVLENDKLLPESAASEYLKDINWEEQLWNGFGFPAFDCKLCITNNILYLEEDAEGKSKVEKLDFTGEVAVNTALVNPKNCGQVLMPTYRLLFIRGELIEAELLECTIQPHKNYEAAYAIFVKRFTRNQKIIKSPLYKYAYIPYYYLIQSLIFVVIYPLNLIIQGWVKLLGYLLFIKI